MNKIDYIRDNLSFIQAKINNDTKLQLYDINKTAEDIFMHLLNLIYGWNLQNANDTIINFPTIDLIDTTEKIAIQVSSDTSKKKVKVDTVEAFQELVKKDEYKIYADYEIKMFYIKDKPSNTTLKNWEDEGLIKQSNILGIEDINKKINADTTHTLTTKVFKYLCNTFHDKVCDDSETLLNPITFKNLNKEYTTPLTCSGLTEKDILVCPINDNYVDEAINNLELAHKCIIKGSSGSGKSLLTYQISKKFYDKTWNVYKYDKYASIMPNYADLDGKVLIIVDDAQTLSSGDFEKLICMAYEELYILMNWNTDTSDNSEFLHSYPSVEVIASDQVELIKKYSLKHQDKIVTVLKQLDIDTNETDYRDNIETRINRASKEITPWLFNYALTEGWRKANSDMKRLSEDKNLDLVLIVVAFFQILTQDKGVKKEIIIDELRHYNQDETWLENANKIIDVYAIKDNEQIVHKHYMYAKKVLYVFESYNKEGEKYSFVIEFLKRLLSSKEYEKGYSSLLEFVMFDCKYCAYILNRDNVTVEMSNYLLKNSTTDNAIKIKNLNSLVRINNKNISIVDSNIEVLNKWIMSANMDTVLPLSELINTLYNDKINNLYLTDEMLSYVLSKVAQSNIIDSAKFSYLYNRLHMFSSKEQKDKCFKNIEKASITFDISNRSLEIDAYHFTKIINNIAYLNESWSQQCVYKNLDFIANAFNRDILKAYRLYGSLIKEYFGIVYRILGVKDDYKNEKLAKKFIKLIKIESILETFSSLTRFNMQDFSMFLLLIAIYDRGKLDEISNKIDYQYLKNIYQEDNNLDHAHKGMLKLLYNPKYKAYQEYVAYLIDRNEYLEEILITLEPDLSEKKLKEGKKYKMHFHGDDGYKFNLAFLKALDKDNSLKLSLSIIKSNKAIIEESIFNNISNADRSKYKYDFLVYLFHKSPNFLKEIFQNKEKVDKHIKKIYTLLRGKKMEKKIGNLYLFFVKEFSEVHQEEIKEIESKFPSTRRFNI